MTFGLNATVMEKNNEKTMKILMLEDNLDDVGLIERILNKDKLSYVRQCVDTRDEFREAIVKFEPDVVLSDHGLPGFNSQEALKICLKERASIPFILVTGTVSDEYAVSCLRDGADDYILKSNLSRLPSAIRSAVKRRQVERLKRVARHTLRRQNDELLKVNNELDNFVYSVSHNLRGPLASLMGLLNIAREEDKECKLAGILDMMGKTMFKLDETFREILDFARNARNEIQFGEISWSSIIQSSFGRLEYLNANNRVSIHIEVKTAIPFYSDENRIGMILTNLFSNAIMYRDKRKEARIDIEVRATDKSTFIVVRDNGIGIAENIMPRIFDMFYRGTEQSQGAGLGLYIVKEAVGKLKGDIEIVSVPNEGTTVLLTMPNLQLCELQSGNRIKKENAAKVGPHV